MTEMSDEKATGIWALSRAVAVTIAESEDIEDQADALLVASMIVAEVAGNCNSPQEALTAIAEAAAQYLPNVVPTAQAGGHA